MALPIYTQAGVLAVKPMVTMGGDLQPGCLADRLLTGLGQPQINPKAQKEMENFNVLLEKVTMNK